MDLPIPKIFGSISTKSYNDICGYPSEILQQLLMTAYSPKISVLSSEFADDIARQFGNVTNVHHLFSYFENILAFGSNYKQKINSTINFKNALVSSSSGCIRFVPDVLSRYDVRLDKVEELFDRERYLKDLMNYVQVIDENINNMNNHLDYDTYKADYNAITKLQNSIYLKIHSLLHYSDSLSPFECFNHPIVQLIVVSGFDSMENIQKFISSIKNKNLPKWLDTSSILQHIIVLVNHGDTEMLQNALHLQEALKVKLGKTSAIVPLDLGRASINEDDSSNLKLYPSIYSSYIKEDGNAYNPLIMNNEAFDAWKRPLQELITKNLVMFMNSRIKLWIEQTVQPRTSLTGRIFGSKKWAPSSRSNFFAFGLNSNSQDTDNTHKQDFKVAGGYYDAQSPEMILRKLGDWYYMLGDFKSAQSTYELVKKDMLADKAYAHLASLNEFIVCAQLLNAVNNSDVVMTPKLITSTIRPMIDSAFYTYLSRNNLESYTIRMSITTAELFMLLGQSLLSQSGEVDRLTELCFNESIALHRKIIDSKLLNHFANSYLMQRIACVFGSYSQAKHFSYQGIEDPYYDEENNIKEGIMNPNLESMGLRRERKQELWLLLSAKQLDLSQQPIQTKLVTWKVQDMMTHSCIPDIVKSQWIGKEGSLFNKLKSNMT